MLNVITPLGSFTFQGTYTTNTAISTRKINLGYKIPDNQTEKSKEILLKDYSTIKEMKSKLPAQSIIYSHLLDVFSSPLVGTQIDYVA